MAGGQRREPQRDGTATALVSRLAPRGRIGAEVGHHSRSAIVDDLQIGAPVARLRRWEVLAIARLVVGGVGIRLPACLADGLCKGLTIRLCLLRKS